MKLSRLVLPFLLLFSCSSMADLGENRELIEQWRVYATPQSKAYNFAAMLYAFDGEDAALAMRCRNQQLELYFMFADKLSAKIKPVLTIKADGQTLANYGWQSASDGKGLFSTEPTNFINALRDKQGIIITYRTERREHKVTAFYLAGLPKVVEKMMATCSFKL